MSGMKKPQYKGTPHPRKRKPLDVITNENAATAAIQQNAGPISAIHQNAAPTPSNRGSGSIKKHVDNLKRLRGVHGSVSLLLEKINALIHKKRLPDKLAPKELENFSRAMSGVQSTLQEWHGFLREVDKRTGAPTETAASAKHHINEATDLIPFAPTVDKRALISDSPLVADNRNESRKTLPFTPELSPSRCRGRTAPVPTNTSIMKVRLATPSSSKKVTFASSPLTITPRMPSPPRSVKQRGPSHSSSSSSSFMSTPSCLRSTVYTVSSGKLSTPRAPADIVSKYSRWFCNTSPDDSPKISPPKTCAFINSESSGEQELGSPITAAMSSPFRTPGLILQSPSSVDSVMPASSTATVDEVTSELAAASI